MMSGQWIYSPGDDLGFLNGTAFLLAPARPAFFHTSSRFQELYFSPVLFM